MMYNYTTYLFHTTITPSYITPNNIIIKMLIVIFMNITQCQNIFYIRIKVPPKNLTNDSLKWVQEYLMHCTNNGCKSYCIQIQTYVQNILAWIFTWWLFYSNITCIRVSILRNLPTHQTFQSHTMPTVNIRSLFRALQWTFKVLQIIKCPYYNIWARESVVNACATKTTDLQTSQCAR